MSRDAVSSVELDDRTATTGLWELPAGWAWAPASSFATVIGGGTPRDAADPANYDAKGVPWLAPADLSDYTRSHIERGARSLSQRGFANSSARLLPAGTVLFSSRAPVGYCVVASNPICTNQGFKSLVLRPEIVPEYIRYYMLFNRGYFVNNASGTTFKELSGSVLADLLFPIAPPNQQQRIVARIDELFAEIDEGEAALERARQGLDSWRRALLKAAVTGELTRDWREANRPAETGADLVARIRTECRAAALRSGRNRRVTASNGLYVGSRPELPEGWVWTKLNDLIISGPSNGYSPKRSKDGSGSLALKLTATTRGSIDLSPKAIKRLSETLDEGSDLFVRPGDLLFQRGNTLEYVGISAVYEGPEGTYVYPDLMIRVRTDDPTLTRWIWRVANSYLGRKHMQDNATGTAGTMPKINGDILLNLPIPLPPYAEIGEILRLVAQGIETTDDFQDEACSTQGVISAFRQSILKAAFEGQLVPQDPADEPAPVLLARFGDSNRQTAARRRRAKAKEPSSHPVLPGFTRQSLDPRVEPAGDD